MTKENMTILMLRLLEGKEVKIKKETFKLFYPGESLKTFHGTNIVETSILASKGKYSDEDIWSSEHISVGNFIHRVLETEDVA